MTYRAMPWHKTPCSGGYEIFNFARPVLGNHYQSHLVCSVPGIKEDFQKNTFSLNDLQDHFLAQKSLPRW